MCVEMRLESMVVPIGGNGMEECEGGGGGGVVQGGWNKVTATDG
jgi:hypothetical protein